MILYDCNEHSRYVKDLRNQNLPTDGSSSSFRRIPARVRNSCKLYEDKGKHLSCNYLHLTKMKISPFILYLFILPYLSCCRENII